MCACIAQRKWNINKYLSDGLKFGLIMMRHIVLDLIGIHSIKTALHATRPLIRTRRVNNMHVLYNLRARFESSRHYGYRLNTF